jgi:hypothetical protein
MDYLRPAPLNLSFEGNNKTVRISVRRPGLRELTLLMICIGLITMPLATLQHWLFRKNLKRYHKIGFPLAAMMAGLISPLGILALIAVIFRQ